ncbi:MAG TPA: ATP-binding protein [Pyrinomonadaceae bacterium]|nr:ATP-binding protein [Pyrinomonadaceae bacterium]
MTETSDTAGGGGGRGRRAGLPSLFYSFSGRLLLVMAILLVSTLGVQYYLNRLAERHVAVTIAEQEQALAASVALALESINTGEYMADIDEGHESSLLTEQRGRVENVLVVRGDGRIDDSLDKAFQPKTLADGSSHYLNIRDISLPRLVNAGHATQEIAQLFSTQPAPFAPVAGERRAFPLRVTTNQGVNYIVVVLGSSDKATGGTTAWEKARPLLPTLAVMLVSTLAAAVLVWRFTRPLSGLAHAARRVAGGDFDFRVQSDDRRDEMGALAANFNEMTAGLRRTRELETRLNQAERSAVIGRLASAIAHEIRNPLNYINLTLDHLRTSLAPSDAKKRETVERLTAQLKAEVARINTRITEFLKYTRPGRLELRPLDLRAQVEDALRMVEVQAAESGVETRVEQDGPLPPVAGDAESLRSVFTNLIINGLQAIEGDGERKGRLTLRLSATDGHARVRVSDNGRGIEPENISQIFEPYFSTKETGTGLGLAIVKKAVEDHGGHIRVESTPGEGTTFTVELPTA